jgi:phosphate transport system protein
MSHHEQELSHLKERLLFMAGHAELAVNRALKALLERDDEVARRVEREDTILDDLEVEIDELCLRLLAKAPLAGELRLITVSMRIARDLERVGDEATTIARRVRELNTEPQLKPYVDIPRMAEIALGMLKSALDAFVDHDGEAARAVVPRDREVDALHRQLQRELVSYMIEKPTTITRCLNLMTISKALERIADHAANLAEEVVFIYEGRDIRHGLDGEASSPIPPPAEQPVNPAS